MVKAVEKEKARELRRKGFSLSTIAKLLKISKSSASVWCEDIKLTKRQQATLDKSQKAAGYRGRMKGAQANKQKRLDALAKHKIQGDRDVKLLSKRDLLMLGLGLYWGEGVKADRGGPATIVNSDPDVILMAMRWFREVLGVSKDDVRPYIYISEIHRPREHKILQYWSKTLGVPQKQFINVVFLKGRPKKKYENYDSYYGILALRIRRSTDLKYKILGLLQACAQQSRGSLMVKTEDS